MGQRFCNDITKKPHYWKSMMMLDGYQNCSRHLPLRLFYLVLSSKLVIEIRGQFHQCSTSSYYAWRSQKRKKDSQVVRLFCAFVKSCKICSQNVDKIDPKDLGRMLWKIFWLFLNRFFVLFLYTKKFIERKILHTSNTFF